MAPEKMVNGVNVDQLFKTIELVKENPEIARFKFRASNTWIGGTHNQATVKDFYGALQEDDSRSPMIFELDEPPVLCGTNQGGEPGGVSAGGAVRLSHDQSGGACCGQGHHRQKGVLALRGRFRSPGVPGSIR